MFDENAFRSLSASKEQRAKSQPFGIWHFSFVICHFVDAAWATEHDGH